MDYQPYSTSDPSQHAPQKHQAQADTKPAQQQQQLTAGEVIDRQTDAMATLKLRRIVNLNNRLRTELGKERVPASQSCLS